MAQVMDVHSGFDGATESWPREANERDLAIEATGSGGRRARLRLWTWLYAQALLQGTIGGVNGVAFIEDGHRRSGRRTDTPLTAAASLRRLAPRLTHSHRILNRN
jgi:hypothetical protein